MDLGVPLRFEGLVFFLLVLLGFFKRKCTLIRHQKEQESAAGRLMLWLHSVVPASAPPPGITATDHWWVGNDKRKV